MDNSQEKTLTQLLATIKTLLLDNALDEALVSIKTVIEQFPQEAEGYFLYAEIYLKKGLNNKAVEYLYKAALLDPNNINYQGRLAEALFLMDKLDAAIEYYQHSLQLDPNAAWAYIGLGNIAEKQVVIDKAIDYFQQALNLNSGNLELRARLLRLKNT
jgi:superkiller protein 3